MLAHTLEAVALQGTDLAFEVIVVVDGSTDGTASLLAARDWGIDLQVIEQPQNGVATARNHGARLARAPLLVFLDDDVAPATGFIEACLRAQSEHPGCVAVGRLAPSDLPNASPPGWWRWLEWQFEKQYADLLAGDRMLDGIGLYAGNFSIPADLFWHVGGFDETSVACEDAELGLRLEQAGARFVFNPHAIGHHSGYQTFTAWRHAAYRGGVWDANQMLRMRKVYTLDDIARDYKQRHPLLRAAAQLLVGRPRAFGVTIAAIRCGATLAGSARLRSVERYAYAAIYDLTHWQGLSDGLGGREILRRYLYARDLPEAA
jgi:GT2 family glycosyltransferase